MCWLLDSLLQKYLLDVVYLLKSSQGILETELDKYLYKNVFLVIKYLTRGIILQETNKNYLFLRGDN